MQTAGIIIEYNPMHNGHVYLMQEIRRQLGEDTALVCAMSGDFVQRGDFALVRRHARARAAVESGADLVLELPLPWAVASAERFADGGVQTLYKTGVVTHLAFGSECGDAAALQEVAVCLESAAYEVELRHQLVTGASYASCRQAAVAKLLGEGTAALLEQPNNTLGIEYCRVLLRRKAGLQPVTVARKGSGYHEITLVGEMPSATMIRSLLRSGQREQALSLMAPAMKEAYLTEELAGRAPVFAETCERAVLARLRAMSEAEFAALDEGREGLYHRLYDASREEVSVEGILQAAKTKRYAYARLRRMVLWAYLGLAPAELPREVPYLRVLAANEKGREVLAIMRNTAQVPVLTKPGDARSLSLEAQKVFAMEVRAADLYAVAYPNLAAAVGGRAWRESPVIL